MAVKISITVDEIHSCSYIVATLNVIVKLRT